jgi:outer membrane protein assembly factor BamB
VSPAGDSSSSDLFVRAYDASSGDLNWEIDRPGIVPATMKLASGRLLVAGAAGSSTYLAAFSKTGASLWDDMVPTSGGILDIAVAGSRIAAAISSGTGFAVRAYSLRTGALEWEDRPTFSPESFESVRAIVLNEDSVYVAGRAVEELSGNSEFLVRAYDAVDGSLLWDDRSHSSTDTAAVDLALGQFRLFVAGYTSDSSTDADFLIRAYDARVDVADSQSKVPQLDNLRARR